jgi:hypothetical protein
MKSPIINIASIELKTHASSYRADRRGRRTLGARMGYQESYRRKAAWL